MGRMAAQHIFPCIRSVRLLLAAAFRQAPNPVGSADFPSGSRPKWKGRIGRDWDSVCSRRVRLYRGFVVGMRDSALEKLEFALFLFSFGPVAGIAGGAMLAMAIREKIKDPEAMKEPLQFLKQSYRMILPALSAHGPDFPLCSGDRSGVTTGSTRIS